MYETISGTVTIGVTLGSGEYGSGLTVDKTGSIVPNESFVAAVYAGFGTFVNEGTIAGSNNFPETPGIGVDVTGDATVSNEGYIIGGIGLFTAGAGLSLQGGTVSNSGTIAGTLGEFYSDPPQHGGLTGGGAVIMSGGVITNLADGVLLGAKGQAIPTGAGGYGAEIEGGLFVNEGTILGGDGGGDNYLAPGGTGVTITGGSLLNFGTIIGGNGGYKYQSNITAPGDGLVLGGGYVENAGIIIGGEGDVEGSSTLNADGFGVYLIGGTLVNDGIISGGLDTNSGRNAAVVLAGSATLVVEPSSVIYGNVVANPDVMDDLKLSASAITSQGSLDMGQSFSGFSTITFDPGTTWNLEGVVANLASGQTIEGFVAGDVLGLADFNVVAETYAGGNGLQLSDGNTAVTLDIAGNFSTNSFLVTNSAKGTEVRLLCYLQGTRIATPAGETPVETLSIGDTVITRFNGYRRIKWIGRQSFARRFIRDNRDQLPIRISAGSLGPNQPHRDLFVSPGHSMLIGKIFVLASMLVNDISVTQNDCSDEVHYYQLEFDSHDCVLAEGTWSESFCDYADLRNQFHNVHDFHILYPNHCTPAEHLMCAPRPENGLELEAALDVVLRRAGGGRKRA